MRLSWLPGAHFMKLSEDWIWYALFNRIFPCELTWRKNKFAALWNHEFIKKLPPPPLSKSYVWCPNMTNDTLLESSYALLIESAKNCKFAKLWIFFDKIQLWCKNVYKKMPKKDKIYVDHAISNMQKKLQNFKLLDV